MQPGRAECCLLCTPTVLCSRCTSAMPRRSGLAPSSRSSSSNSSNKKRCAAVATDRRWRQRQLTWLLHSSRGGAAAAAAAVVSDGQHQMAAQQLAAQASARCQRLCKGALDALPAAVLACCSLSEVSCLHHASHLAGSWQLAMARTAELQQQLGSHPPALALQLVARACSCCGRLTPPSQATTGSRRRQQQRQQHRLAVQTTCSDTR